MSRSHTLTLESPIPNSFGRIHRKYRNHPTTMATSDLAVGLPSLADLTGEPEVLIYRRAKY